MSLIRHFVGFALICSLLAAPGWVGRSMAQDVRIQQYPTEAGKPPARVDATPVHPAPAPAVTAPRATPIAVTGEPAAAAGPAAVMTPSAGTSPASDATGEPAADETASTATAQPPAVVVEPLGPQIAEQVKRIAGRSAHRADVTAVAAYYTQHPDKPLWIEGRAMSERAREVIAELRRASDWGLRAADFSLPAGEAGPDRESLSQADARLSLAVLKYARHARGGRIDPRQLSDDLDRTRPLMDPGLVLAGIATASSPAAFLRKLHPQHPQFERLRRLYLALKAGTMPSATDDDDAAATSAADNGRSGKRKSRKSAARPQPITVERVLINMEQWRWMPEDLGRFHVAVNVPEFVVRVMKTGKVIHTERVITGQVDKQTAIFSKDMDSVVFQPGWGVPNSIKVKELLPGLLRGQDTLARRGLVASYRGREIDPTDVDWSRVDIRDVDVVQPPGSGNALGKVKFLFPNKHAIYMHDTPTKYLFKKTVRNFSHGCVRVKNPLTLAKILFQETAGWSSARIDGLIRRGPPENRVMLKRKVPVHLTYFTVTVDDAGKPSAHRDIYGHERLIQLGLEGKAHKIVKKREDLADVRARVLSRNGVQRRPATARRRDARRDTQWTRNVFRY